jgi:ABC-type methionine transport system ATPase subunit
MGMLFQYSALFDSMTVEENIAFPMKLFTKMSKKEIKNRVEFCLERVTMANTNHLFPAELSGGMMKRVGIARAIALNPKYLFVDEPNSGLDPLTASVIDKLIQELTYEFNTCTVVVSHDMNSVVNISDNIMFLYKGQKAWEGDKKAILRSGNPELDRFVFVSDLIRRDLYDEPGQEHLDAPKENPIAESPKAEEIAPEVVEIVTKIDEAAPEAEENVISEPEKAEETVETEADAESPDAPKSESDQPAPESPDGDPPAKE